MKIFFSMALGALVLLQPILVRADEAGHRAAAESLLVTMETEKMTAASVDQMLQIQLKQNPAIAPFEQQMRGFLNKYMSWASLKDDMINIYTSEFTEQELKDLTTFYKTPLGQKTVQKIPQLLSKGAELSQKRVQEHLPELQAAIQAQAGALQQPQSSPAKQPPSSPAKKTP